MVQQPWRMLQYNAPAFVRICLRINSRSILWPLRQQPVCKRVNDLKPPEIKMVKDFQPQDHHKKNCLIHISLSPCDVRTLSACCSPACAVPTLWDVCSALPHSYPASHCCLDCHLSPGRQPSSCHPTRCSIQTNASCTDQVPKTCHSPIPPCCFIMDLPALVPHYIPGAAAALTKQLLIVPLVQQHC